MRWISFAIILFLTTVLQVTIAPFFAVHGIRFDLLVILAIHYALAARNGDAQIACWTIGLAADLSSLDYTHHANVGIHAIAFGLVGILTVAARELTFRESVITQLMATFAAGLLIAFIVGLHMMYAVGAWDRFGEVLLIGFYSSFYTALIAPYGHWLLRRLRGPLGIGQPHRVRNA